MASLEQDYSSLEKATLDEFNKKPNVSIHETDEDAVLLKETMLVSTDPKISKQISDALTRMYSRGPSGARIIEAVMNEKRRTILKNQVQILKYTLIKKWYEEKHIDKGKSANYVLNKEMDAKQKIDEVLHKQASHKSEIELQEKAFIEEERALFARREAFAKNIVEKHLDLEKRLQDATNELEEIRSSDVSKDLEFYSFVRFPTIRPRTELEFVEQLTEESMRCEQTIQRLRGY